MNELISSDDCDKLGLEKVKELYKKYVSFSQEKLASSFGYGHDLVDYAEGCWIYTKSGRKILDFTGGIGVLNHGHNHPRILKARLEFQKLKKMEVHKSFLSPYIAALSHNIAQILPEDLNVSFFPNSGAEAVDGAIKLAYKYHNGKRNHILHSDISFHGKLLGCGSLGGSPEFHFEFPKIPNTHAFEYNSIESVKRLLELLKKADGTSDIYAIILEPFSASSLRKCSSDFLYELQDLCRKNAIVLIFDEVYSGWAKTGELFYFMHFSNLVPDILATSKSLGGGKASI
jgi:putrescine aminotransferase